MEKQGELEKLEGELEKQGEAKGRNKGSLGSGLDDGTKPQELPVRDVGRENGMGDSNLEERDETEFKIEKKPRSHLFDRASPLRHRVRVRFVAVSRRASAVIGLAPRSFSVNILVCKNLVLSPAGRCDPLEVLARAPPVLLLPLHALPGSQHQGHTLQRGRARHLQFSIRALFFSFSLIIILLVTKLHGVC